MLSMSIKPTTMLEKCFIEGSTQNKEHLSSVSKQEKINHHRAFEKPFGFSFNFYDCMTGRIATLFLPPPLTYGQPS